MTSFVCQTGLVMSGAEMKRERRLRRWTQEHMAAQLGVSNSTISAWEQKTELEIGDDQAVRRLFWPPSDDYTERPTEQLLEDLKAIATVLAARAAGHNTSVSPSDTGHTTLGGTDKNSVRRTGQGSPGRHLPPGSAHATSDCEQEHDL